MKNWLEWAMKIAEEWKLQEDVKKSYYKYIDKGFSEEQSAGMALYDWDL